MKKIRRIISLILLTTMLISIGVCFSFADTSKVDMNSNSEILAIFCFSNERDSRDRILYR